MAPITSGLLLSLAALGAAWDHSLYTSSPPVYPSPNITGSGDWTAALQQAKEFLAELSLAEKVDMVTGTTGPCPGNIPPIERLNFKGLCLQDGPLAIRQAVYASVFPAGLTAAASWDRDLMYRRGVYMGAEFRGKGAHIALSPVAGPLGRSPYGGRNWEGFSPDPYLTGVGMEETVSGIQKAGVQACSKHYIGNEQETQRNPSTNDDGATIEALSSNIDDRTMHEMYLWPWANAVRAGTASIMCSYNRLNGSYGCQNSKILNGLLKTELGFQGYVMSDWGATHSGVASIEAGEDMNMPGGISFTSATPSYWGANLTLAVNNGTIPESRVDDMVLRIMTPYFHLKQNEDYPPIDESGVSNSFFPESTWVKQFDNFGPTTDVRSDQHTSLIRELAGAGTVLLKNVQQTLPLKQPKNIAVLGNDAGDFTNGMYSLSLTAGISAGNYDIGVLAVGGGSGTGRFSYISVPLDAIKEKAKKYNGLVQYILNNEAITNGGLSTLAPAPDVCIVFLKSWATEGVDRTSLLPEWNGTNVVNAVTATCNNTVVVLHGAGPIVMPFADNENITAIVASHMPGQEAGNALVDVLFGDVNPSGHLPYTIAKKESDYAHLITNSTDLLESTDPNAWQADFTEMQLIDYREFDYENKTPLYEFGYGLSYTTFSLSNLQVQKVVTNATKTPTGKIVPGGHQDLWDTFYKVTAAVSNTGSRDGATVPQLYLSFGQPAENTPKKVLRGFEKVQLATGESKTVTFELARRDVSYWDVLAQQWTLAGDIGVSVGFSSRDLKLTGKLGQ